MAELLVVLNNLLCGDSVEGQVQHLDPYHLEFYIVI